jgi:hypothetical protein
MIGTSLPFIKAVKGSKLVPVADVKVSVGVGVAVGAGAGVEVGVGMGINHDRLPCVVLP